jgi:dihydrofolate reductase
MRRIVMFNRVTADGYFAGPNGDLEWVVPDEEMDRGAAARMSERGTILFGRKTYEMFASFWPRVVDDTPSAPNPHDARRRSPEMRAMGVWLNEATKLVYSTTLRRAEWANSHVRSAFDPDEIAALKAQPGGDILVFGSGSLVSQLTEHALIDEYQFVVTPTLLGSGQPLIRGVTKRLPLTLSEATAYPSGNVMLRYLRQT